MNWKSNKDKIKTKKNYQNLKLWIKKIQKKLSILKIKKFYQSLKACIKKVPKKLSLLKIKKIKIQKIYQSLNAWIKKILKKLSFFQIQKRKILITKNTINFKSKIELKPIEKNGRKILAEIQDLFLGFRDTAQPTKINNVLRGVSLELYEGEILAIIGESGSGKTVLSSTLYGMPGSTAVYQGGKVKLLNQEVHNFTEKIWDKCKYRGSIISAVFQNPMTTLNPTMKIKYQIMEGILVNGFAKRKKDAYKIALDFLNKTRIDNPKKVMNMYPHELSGGMKQRVIISAIVACRPKIIIMDEPTTALDPSIQAEVLDIVKELASEYKISIIFITHDLGVVASIADRIAIMYAGQIIEVGKTREILYYPQHPYAWGLLLSMPDVNTSTVLKTIRGSVPADLNKIIGEAFSPRNDYALGIDFLKEAPWHTISDTHFVKSWLLDERAPKYNPPEIIQTRWDIFLKENEQGV